MQISNQGLLNHFSIRRLKFFQQARDEEILLWMVVAITVSGVGLAALQLFASFKLASAGQSSLDSPGELSLEKGRLSFRSSITGLFILLISFAFFYIFVSRIYVLRDIRIDPESASAQAPQQIEAGLLEVDPAPPSPSKGPIP